MRRYPWSPRFLLSVDGGRRSRAVRTLAGTADWRRDLVDRLGGAVVAAVGTAPLRPSAGWTWPDAGPDELVTRLHDVLPDLEIIAAVVPRQTGRRRLSALCRWRDDDLVLKLGMPADGLETEAAALRALTRRPLPGIRTPRLIEAGRLDEAEFVLTTALALGRQRPAIDAPLRTFEADLGERLAGLPRPEDTPPHFVPVHGDLAPWNLRRTGHGLALFDWEAAGWGPPGSDLAFYRRSCQSLRRR